MSISDDLQIYSRPEFAPTLYRTHGGYQKYIYRALSWFKRTKTLPTGLAVSVNDICERLRLSVPPEIDDPVEPTEPTAPANPTPAEQATYDDELEAYEAALAQYNSDLAYIARRDAEIADLSLMISSSESWFQDETGHLLMPQTVEVCYDGFPATEGQLPCWMQPTRSITALTYLAEDGTSTVMPAADYRFQRSDVSANLYPVKRWPVLEQGTPYHGERVILELECGYADTASIPFNIKLAIMLHVGLQYQNREPQAEANRKALPYGLTSILNQFRVDTGLEDPPSGHY